MNRNIHHFFRYQFPAIFWAMVIFFLSSIPGSKIPKFARLFNDKFLHTSIFFVLGILMYRALEPRTKASTFDWRRLFIAISAVILYGVSDEFHQGFVPGRSVDVYDAAADSLGGILSAAVIYLHEKLKNRS